MNKPWRLECKATVLTGERAGYPCGNTATAIAIWNGEPICGTHARAYTKVGVARLAYWNEKERAWS